MEVYRVEIVEIESLSMDALSDLDLAESEFGELGGCLCETWFDVDGKRHRNGGPAVTVRDPITGEVLIEVYYQRGNLHREDGPARSGQTSMGWRSDEWYIEGKLSRDGAPAKTIKNGHLILIEEWCRAGQAHRDFWPAHVVRADNGMPIEETWIVNGVVHNPFGPARVSRNEDNGIIYQEEWIQRGLTHRTDGPAVITRDGRTGEVKHQEFHVHGTQVAPFKGWLPNISGPY